MNKNNPLFNFTRYSFFPVYLHEKTIGVLGLLYGMVSL